MSRFYAPGENIKGNLIHIDGQEARHILNVMRLGSGDKVVVFDGTGKEYAGFIKEVKSKSLIVEIIKVKSPKKEILPAITLAQAIPKKQKMDYIVEKATELGVSEIIPVISERTIVKVDEIKLDKRSRRWQKIAEEAAKQCGRSDIPKIKKADKFYNVISSVNDYDLSLIAHLAEERIPLKESLIGFRNGKIIVFIGPEGDFTPEEILMAKETPSKFISLGSRVLKSDTAGLYVLSILNYELSN